MQIRKASAEDLEIIRAWLQQENDGHHSFICNFNLIADGQAQGELTVLVEDIPIAFALGSDNLAILAVKRDRRAKGAGTMLAQQWFHQARDRDLMGFHGECAPRTSLKFWKKMGCIKVAPPYRTDDIPWVCMPFRKTHKLPNGVATVALTFAICDSDDTPMSEWNFNTVAAIIDSDDYMLAEDFVAFVPNTDARL